MDDLTHAALGLTAGQCGLTRRLGRAGIGLSLAASWAPDLDVFYKMGDPWSTIQHHRVLTHSVLVAPAIGLVLAGLWWLWQRKQFGWAWLAATVTVLIHIALDTCTSYGTVLLAPLSYRRFALDCVAIVDLAYTLVLIAGLVICWRLNRRGVEGRARRAAIMALAISTAYLGVGMSQHAIAMRAVRRHAETHGHSIVRAGAYPQLGTIFVWRAVYRDDTNYYLASVHTLSREQPEFTVLPISTGPLVDASANDPKVRLFRWFARQTVRPERLDTPNGPAVLWQDMRYAWPMSSPRSLWSVLVTFDGDRAIKSVKWIERRHEPEGLKT